MKIFVILSMFLILSCSSEATNNYDALVRGSDNYSKYKEAFATAAKQLILSGDCETNDFEYIGGWAKSSNHQDQPVYFMYCGEMSDKGRIYLNARTGEIFR